MASLQLLSRPDCNGHRNPAVFERNSKKPNKTTAVTVRISPIIVTGGANISSSSMQFTNPLGARFNEGYPSMTPTISASASCLA
jgi:hypothetical protein